MQIISYDESSGTLVVALPTHPPYEVFDVPLETFRALQQSAAPKAYFDEHIWGNKFEHDSHWPDLATLLEYMGENMSFEPPVTVHSKRFHADTPLHVACVWGDLTAIDLLVAGGAEVNARGEDGATPLRYAVTFERVRSVERLLRAGATADDPDDFGFTAREKALKSKNPRLVALFT